MSKRDEINRNQHSIETRSDPSIHVRMADYGSSRNVDHSRAEGDLVINIKKATNAEETAPKRKHVRSCIVYTWDHRSSQSFWAGLKVQPILADEIQTFKALICVHKVLQEGHPVTLREAQAQTGWLDTCTRSVVGEGPRGYGPLIRAYVDFLLAKLQFHRHHPDFNGTFEYEEYIALKMINDPNEGYETITDLMTLQDRIEAFQKLIFAHFRSGSSNECRISALVPLVVESYGIYKFITSMLRAMHANTDSSEALEPLRSRYNAQHYRLLKFYYECSNLKYLTGLIAVPKLPQDPPSLIGDDSAPSLPKRPVQEAPREPSPPARAAQTDAEPIPDFWTNQQLQQQREYEEEQQRLQQEREADIQRQQMMALQQQRDFEEQQRLLAEQQRMAQEQLMRDQYQQQAQGRLAELEREILNMRGQFERDQLMLEQYDRRVKALELDLQQVNANASQQLHSKDELIAALQEQLATWRNKYESLAKLYSQLRQEHLDLLAKYKSMQLKAASAQEAIDKKERIEREMKAKNLELADMIRERDRARYDLDKLKGGQREEVEKLKRELRFAEERAEAAEKTKSSEVTTMLSKYNREMAELESSLRAKQTALDEMSARLRQSVDENDRALREKDEELEIYKAGMDSTLLQLNELQLNHAEGDKALDSQIDNVLLDHLRKLNDIIDAVLQSAVQRIDDSLYELDSPMQAGNQNSTPEYLLSMIEKCSSSATEFATAFNNFIADGPNGSHAEIIRTANVYSSAVADVLTNAKGIIRLVSDEKKEEAVIGAARDSAVKSQRFFTALASYRLTGVSPDQKTEIVIINNLEAQKALQKLSKLTETIAPKNAVDFGAKGDLGDLVDRELNEAANVIERATARLQALLAKPKDPRFSSSELQVHETLLGSAMAITNAIALLIKAATESQREIVAEGRGSSSKAAFYKRNNRWTEGLISAAKAVAASTNILIETADGVISGRNSPEQLIVASNEVAAATAQLVAASRVKASFMSKTQERLENAAKAVTNACKALVRQVKEIAASRFQDQDDGVNYGAMAPHEFKVREMEQQVEILKLENELTHARRRLGEMRKISYQEE
ncbi:hypothetical protein G7K_6616-t1 [Saitoella complicata NRRL Y-17804]|uniref:Cytoskeleton assembly control protein n=1 Tax=Saitoella complicata (strain BCRC 22490 / CBS 7301 / JCM 7358 / NBRC 10748 / NRRL Y-17804) TaxID=698492 RepID=A0A0E9NRP8_SAICN|nr:hypothetical protein G7K_6616-t1 [Saitoella complicata NRRL Y-17804]